jgi:hypothetical protein
MVDTAPVVGFSALHVLAAVVPQFCIAKQFMAHTLPVPGAPYQDGLDFCAPPGALAGAE